MDLNISKDVSMAVFCGNTK